MSDHEHDDHEHDDHGHDDDHEDDGNGRGCCDASCGELVVDVQINRGNADAGDSGATVPASALISVLVTRHGRPVDDLGASVGTQTSGITLPPEWTLRDGFNVRPGGCLASVTEFANLGGGLYDIRIVPYLGNPACTWLSGEYVYGIQIEAARTVDGRPLVLQGGALAKLTIP